MVTAALVAAMLSASAWLQIPIQPVPITLQVFFVILAALLLPPMGAFAAVGVYVGLGAIGVPVFAGGSGGLGVLAGPTGGYLIGFLIAATIGSGVRTLLGHFGVKQLVADVAAAALAIAIIYAVGPVQLAVVAKLTAAQSITAGVLPFIAVDFAKAAVAVGVAAAVRRALDRS
jgi:biotin transport system substrate-specific component